MATGRVRVERPAAQVAELVVDRPPLNVLDETVQAELTGVLRDLHEAGDVRCLLVRGEGTTAFSVGADVKALYGATDPDPWLGVDLSGHWTRLLESFPGLTVSCVRGHCLGGGLELALCTDVRIASPDARFGFPEVRLGLVPGMGGTARLPRVVGESWAKRMIMTGAPVSTEQAVQIGLVQQIAAAPACPPRRWPSRPPGRSSHARPIRTRCGPSGTPGRGCSPAGTDRRASPPSWASVPPSSLGTTRRRPDLPVVHRSRARAMVRTDLAQPPTTVGNTPTAAAVVVCTRGTGPDRDGVDGRCTGDQTADRPGARCHRAGRGRTG